MPVEKGPPEEADTDTILTRLGLPPKHLSKPASEEEILAHLQDKKPEEPIDPDELGMVKEVGGFLDSLFGDKH